MTIKENSSPYIEFQIFFWDTVINIMSTIRKLRLSINPPARKPNTRYNVVKTLIFIMFVLALGLYTGILLGYLGI